MPRRPLVQRVMEVRTLRALTPQQGDLAEYDAVPMRPAGGNKRGPSGGFGATARTRSAASSSSATEQLVPNLNRLAIQKVRPQTQRLYTGVLLLLSAWLRRRPLPEWDGPVWGEVTANFVEWLFDRNYTRAAADRVIPAL